MLDDGIFAKCVFGARKLENNCFGLLVADPHINRNDFGDLQEVGLYQVILN